MRRRIRHPDPTQLLPGSYTAVGYRSASTADTMGRSASAGSGERHQQTHRTKLHNLSRELFRDGTLYHSLISSAVAFVVGGGFGLQAETASKAWNAKREALHHEWWLDPEIKGTMSGLECEDMICRETMLCGDTGIVLTAPGHIQLVEAEQIKGKNRTIGYYKNKWGRPTTWCVSPYGPYGQVNVKAEQKYSPDEFLFVSAPERPSAIRCVPLAQAAFPMIHRIEDVMNSEAIAWQTLARMALVINRTAGTSLAHGESRENEGKSDQDMEGDSATRVTDLGYAMMFHAEPGEELKGVDRNIPGKDFTASLTTFIRLMGLVLGMPLELVMMNWEKSNFAQAKGVLELVQQRMKRHQFRQRDRAMRRIYNWKTDWLIDAGLITDRSDRYKHQWVLPPVPWFDKLKEAQSYGVQMDRGFGTHTEVLLSKQKDRTTEMDRRESEIGDAIERANKLEKKYPGRSVPYEPFCGLKANPTAGRPGGAAPSDPFQKKLTDSDDDSSDSTPAAPADPAAPEAPAAPAKGTKAVTPENIKASLDAYGIGVRAGAITPQTADEDDFRSKMGLPAVGKDVKGAWTEDGGVRRPVTLKGKAEQEKDASGTEPKDEEKPDDK